MYVRTIGVRQCVAEGIRNKKHSRVFFPDIIAPADCLGRVLLRVVDAGEEEEDVPALAHNTFQVRVGELTVTDVAPCGYDDPADLVLNLRRINPVLNTDSIITGLDLVASTTGLAAV